MLKFNAGEHGQSDQDDNKLLPTHLQHIRHIYDNAFRNRDKNDLWKSLKLSIQFKLVGSAGEIEENNTHFHDNVDSAAGIFNWKSISSQFAYIYISAINRF